MIRLKGRREEIPVTETVVPRLSLAPLIEGTKHAIMQVLPYRFPIADEAMQPAINAAQMEYFLKIES